MSDFYWLKTSETLKKGKKGKKILIGYYIFIKICCGGLLCSSGMYSINVI